VRIRLNQILVILFAVFLAAAPAFIGISSASASSNSSTQGYVTYQVTLNRGTNQTSFVLNESSVPTSQSGFVNLTLSLTSSLRDFSYSRVVNASAFPEIFPFVPGIANQSFSYQTHGISINARISTGGSSPISFGGATYVGSKYNLDLSVTNSSSGKSVTAVGNLVVLPSGLLYSVQLQEAGNSGNSASVQLLKTSLPLNDPSNSDTTTEGAALIGAGLLGSAAFAIPFWKYRKNKKNSPGDSEEPEKKPSYWVD
jgi:hypothetical protein